VRHSEHTRYIRYSHQQPAYAVHTVNNRHEYGPINETVGLLKTCTMGTKMTSGEAPYMQTYQEQGQLIKEQQAPEHSPLFTLARNTGQHEMTQYA
jgi:hypothetical protein